MTVPRCRADGCTGVADDGATGLCAGHRRGLTLSTKMTDAVREFLHGTHLPHSAIRPTGENARKVVESGEYLAQGLALLISTRFDDVSFDPSPLYAADLRYGAHAPWRVSFAWRAHEMIERDDDAEDESDDCEELETDDP